MNNISSHTPDLYCGDFPDGIKHGHGILICDKGTYTGEFQNDRKEGFGVMEYKNGMKYAGEWTAGKIQGFGSMFLTDGCVYEGNWVNHKHHGQGAMRYSHTFKWEKYVGEFILDKRRGYGVLFYRNGKIEAGRFYSDRQNANRLVIEESEDKKTKVMKCPLDQGVPQSMTDYETVVREFNIAFRVHQGHVLLKHLSAGSQEMLHRYCAEGKVLFAMLLANIGTIEEKRANALIALKVIDSLPTTPETVLSVALYRARMAKICLEAALVSGDQSSLMELYNHIHSAGCLAATLRHKEAWPEMRRTLLKAHQIMKHLGIASALLDTLPMAPAEALKILNPPSNISLQIPQPFPTLFTVFKERHPSWSEGSYPTDLKALLRITDGWWEMIPPQLLNLAASPPAPLCLPTALFR